MKSFPTSSRLSKPGGTKEKLLKLIRSHPACVLALRLDVTMRISDEDIMEGLANSADNLDIDFRERMVPEEIIQEILNLRREARAEAALMSKIRRHNVWIVLIRLPLCASGILVFFSLLLWPTTFEYTRAVCALYEFANATCSQANTCLFRVAVQLPGEEFSIFHPAWKMPAEEAYGTTIFAQNGPFKCCNSPRFYATGGAATAIEAIGAGTPCCDFLDENRSLFCDNFGDLDRRPHPVSDCPASPWHCGVKTEIIDRETHVKYRHLELRPWVEAPSLEIFLASLACLGTAGAVRLFPHFVAFMGRHLEHCAASFQIYARGAKRRLRRLRNRSRNRSSRLSTSSEAEVEVSERRTSRKAKAKATAKVREVEPEEVMSTDGSEVASRALQLMQPRASQQAANEVGFTVQPSVVTVAVRAAKVQPQATHSSAPKTEAVKTEPVRLEEILRPIITPATRRSDNSRDRDHWDQAPRQPAAAAPATQHLLRAKARPRPRRAPHAVAPQATASPAKVMQMSQTQEQWMATSAQLRQLSQSQAPPPDVGIAPRRNKGRGTLPPRATQI